MTHQGFIGSFSTSALLVSSAVAILLAVSAIVAFEGWPGPSAEAPTKTFLLTGGGASEDARPKPELVLDPPRREPASAERGATGGGAAPQASGAAEASSQAAGLESAHALGGEPTAPGDALAPVAPGGGSSSLEGGGASGGSVGGSVDRATDAVNQVDELRPVTDRVGGLVRGAEPVTDAIGVP